MQTRSVIITPALAGRTAESVMKSELEISGARISRLKRSPSGVMLNGVRVYTTARTNEGDVLTVETGDDPARPTAAPVPMPLDIVFEDEWLAVVNKPANLAVQPTREPKEISLEHGLAAYLTDGAVAHPVSRLDKMTSGLMTVAKSGYVHELMKRRMHTDAFIKEYLGIAVGSVTPAHGLIDAPIGFYEGSSYQRAIRPDGQRSLTEYEALRYANGYTLLRLIPHTGRTHQLRLHMAYVGYPLAGDFLYGRESAAIGRAALHSRLLRFVHPITGEALSFEAPLPEDMRRLLETE